MEVSEKDTVLAVDDDSANLMAAQQILKTRYNIAAAKSGEKALQYLESHIPGLILMDIKMPEMDGFETVKRIKENEKLKNIPVIFLTADMDPETEKKCFDVGAVDYVTKPFVPDVLISRVSRSLEIEKHRQNLESLVAERTSELVEALRVKSDFLTNMSHEIRTPLNAVLGLAEMALCEEMTPAAQDYIRQIRASGKNLLVIINDILDLSNIERGKMEILPAVYDISSLIEDVSGMVCNYIGDRDLKFVTDIAPDIPGQLIGDNARIQQIMINLLNNAVKFTEQGQIGLKLYCEGQGDENILIKCEITDTGIGIREEDIPKLFGSFQQLDSKRNRNAEGTGLGLKISKQLLELMGGSIGVRSVYGQGSTFFFELPQKIADDSAEEKPFIAPDAQVLIVDDHPTNILVAKGLLEPLQMKIDTAESAGAAIELVRQKKYDIIFMDHMMPQMDGVEATRIIRQSIAGYENAPIIALTANALPDAKEMFIREGMSDFAAKPVGAKTMTEIVRRFLPPEKINYVEGVVAEESDASDLVIDGLNVADSISLVGSKDLYLMVLKDYFLGIDKRAAVIRGYYENEQWSNYTIEVHSLKSTSRQIGAHDLAELAYELERAGNDGDIALIREKTDRLLEMYTALKQIIAPVFPEYLQPQEKQAASAETTKELLGELSEALESFDWLAIADVLEKMGQYLFDEKHTGLLHTFSELAEEGDMDKIEELIAEWQSEIAADTGTY